MVSKDTKIHLIPRPLLLKEKGRIAVLKFPLLQERIWGRCIRSKMI